MPEEVRSAAHERFDARSALAKLAQCRKGALTKNINEVRPYPSCHAPQAALNFDNPS